MHTDHQTLLESFTASHNSGVFEFEYKGILFEEKCYDKILKAVLNSFVVEEYYVFDKIYKSGAISSIYFRMSPKLFFLGIIENHIGLDFVVYPEILDLSVYADATFNLSFRENVFTDELYFFQNGENNDRVDFGLAGKLNRFFLSEALKNIERLCDSLIVGWHCELPVFISKYGFSDESKLGYERQ